MKTFFLVILAFVTLISCPQSSYGLVLPIPTTTTPFPWAEFVKQKFASLPLAPKPVSPVPSTTPKSPESPVVYSESVLTDFVKQLIAHIKAKAGNQTQIEVSTTVAPSTTTTEESTENNYEDALLREVYLDWGKRHARQVELTENNPEQDVQSVPDILSVPDFQNIPEIQSVLPPPAVAPVNIPAPPVANPMYPSVPLTYGYPAPFPLGLYNSLAAFKVQKGIIQAQVDAALAAMSITTTPKPTKIKLKFMLPAGSSLPAGLENFLVS